MKLLHLDHFVLTVTDLQNTLTFYTQNLGMTSEEFLPGRFCLKYGAQKINLHLLGSEFEPKAKAIQVGSADLCFILGQPVALAQQELEAKGVKIEEGPVNRTGAQGTILSIYIRDPDGNLIELAEPI